MKIHPPFLFLTKPIYFIPVHSFSVLRSHARLVGTTKHENIELRINECRRRVVTS